LGEIGESLNTFGTSIGKLHFLPNRGNFTRGILATAYTKFDGSLEEAKALFSDFYKSAQNMNLIFGWEEDLGLKLKAGAF